MREKKGSDRVRNKSLSFRVTEHEELEIKGRIPEGSNINQFLHQLVFANLEIKK